MLLAADVGATKTTLAIITPEAGPRAPHVTATFPSSKFTSIEALIHGFLSKVDAQIEYACLGVAGPVVQGEASITNLPWIVDGEGIKDEFKLSSVHLLNDLVAIAHSVPYLESEELHCLAKGRPSPGGAMAVIAPGTGLGEAYLTWDGTKYNAHASEGGHTDFAPRNQVEYGLLSYLQERFGHVSYERVCSGIGLPTVYAFLRDSRPGREREQIQRLIEDADDPTPILVTAALETIDPCPLCLDTLQTFVSILGAEAGNLALKVLATGGIYLGGGMPPRILSVLEQGVFLDAFRDKGRFASLMAKVPVHVITEPNAGLLGAAYYGLESILSSVRSRGIDSRR